MIYHDIMILNHVVFTKQVKSIRLLFIPLMVISKARWAHEPFGYVELYIE